MATTTDPLLDQEDPQDGPEIRRQVEYYFSDENLPSDTHLLACCGGRDNLPVSISRICGFKKMRKYKKKVVVQALRKSTFLVVTEDGKQVSRKVALQGQCALDEGYFDDTEIAYDPRARVPAVLPVPLLPQEKKVYPVGMSKNMMKPTGFEKTYVEPPITPDEAKDEAAMYDPVKSFVERIEVAIQRFKKKRRMHEKYSHVFNKWMHFGGVETGPRMFGGLSRADMTNMDAEEIARATASHHVSWERNDTRFWTVDFVGVAEAFLSTYIAPQYSHNPEQVKSACQVLRSFYNYLLYHSVCPEFNDDLSRALYICDKAETELPQTYTAGLVLPGAFNTAASTIFGGSKAGLYTGDKEWAIRCKEEGVDLSELGVMNEEARITFRSGIAILGTDQQQDMLDTKAVKVLQDVSLCVCIDSIELPDELTREMYDRQNNFTTGKLKLEPLGKMVCRSWQVDDFSEYDLPLDRYPTGRPSDIEADREFVFWVEESVLKECFLGMKLEARVLVLEGGINVLDDVAMVMCSFYSWLPNELLWSHHPKQVNVKENNVGGGVEDGPKEDEGGGEGKFADDESVGGE